MVLHCNAGVAVASNQALPLHTWNIISACKEGESLEDFDHVLDVVGRGYHVPISGQFRPHGYYTWQAKTWSASYKLQRFLVVVYGGSNDQET